MTKIEDLIPKNLEMSTRDRLLLVADIIEAEPQKWHQDTFLEVPGSDEPSPWQVVSKYEIKCGTTACVAGWGVLTSPVDLIAEVPVEGDDEDWDRAGAKVFGFTEELAARVFYDFERDPERMAEKLRLLAELPEPRTLKDARLAGYRRSGEEGIVFTSSDDYDEDIFAAAY